MISRGRRSSVRVAGRLYGSNRRFEPGKEGQVRSTHVRTGAPPPLPLPPPPPPCWLERGPWIAGLDCCRWDARVWPYLENANLISVRTAEERGPGYCKVYNKRNGRNEPYIATGPSVLKCFLQEGMGKRVLLPRCISTTLRYGRKFHDSLFNYSCAAPICNVYYRCI